MVDFTSIVMKEILKSYHGFNNLKRVVDVGGGLGMTLSMIVSKYPTITGINFDLPHVIRGVVCLLIYFYKAKKIF